MNGATRPCPYAGVSFPVTLKFPENYPHKHPEMMFVPGVLYHPNVSPTTGEICADSIEKCFGPTKNVLDLGTMVRTFMTTPNLSA